MVRVELPPCFCVSHRAGRGYRGGARPGLGRATAASGRLCQPNWLSVSCTTAVELPRVARWGHPGHAGIPRRPGGLLLNLDRVAGGCAAG